MIGEVPQMLGELEGSKKLEEALDWVNRPAAGNDESTPGVKTAPTTGGATQVNENGGIAGSRQKAFQKLAEVYNSDIAGLFLCSTIMQGFVDSMQFPGSTFRVLDAEKKANVLYMHMQTIFPATSKTKKVYWDREAIVVGNTQFTYVVSTSAPSLDQRPSSGPWITAWLAGLRVPLE
jgi:hypothetical protein